MPFRARRVIWSLRGRDWSVKRGIFKGKMNRNISPLNGVLPTLPLLAKWVAARRRRNPPKSNGTVQNRWEGQAPALRHYTTQGRRAQWSRPTQTTIVACSPRHPKGAREDVAPCGYSVRGAEGGGPPPLRCTPPKIAHSHTFIGNCAPPCPFAHKKSPACGRGNR